MTSPSLFPSASPSFFPTSQPSIPPDTTLNQTQSIIRGFQIWGSAFLVCVIIYIVVRPRFPLVFNFRNTVPKYNTPLSAENHGSIRWIWRIYKYSDDEILEHCGMDGIVLIRIVRLGLKLSCVGVINSIYLFPIYVYGCPRSGESGYNDDCANNRDSVASAGLSNVAQGSDYLWATTFSAYVLFCSAMKFLLEEFEWFTQARHKFLSRARPDNYTIYVAHIPEEYRSDIALLEYFQSIFDAEDVVDAKIARDIPALDYKVALREEARTELESAINYQHVKKKDPTLLLKTGKTVDPITHYTQQIKELDSEILRLFSDIDDVKAKEEKEYLERRNRLSKIISQHTADEAGVQEVEPRPQLTKDVYANCNRLSKVTGQHSGKRGVEELSEVMTDVKGLAVDSANEGVVADIKELTIDSAMAPQRMIKGMYDLIKRNEEGEARDAGFVSFSRLWCNAQALQTVHDETPFRFEVVNAPLPTYIFWGNVGLSHKKIQLGIITANSMWIALCLFWTIITAALGALVDIKQLEEEFPGLKGDSSDLLRKLLSLLSPLLTVLTTALIPPILKFICRYEGHISLTALDASLYSKISWFFIIQIFYMRAIAGGIINRFDDIINNPTVLISSLGTEIPRQVGPILTYIMLKTFLQCVIELLRVGPIFISLLRRCFGPNLTEKESQRTWRGLTSLFAPQTLDYPRTMSYIMLNFIALLVFSCIAPIMNYILVLMFLLHSLIYRNELIYTYSDENDSGGQFWAKYMRIMMYCMVAAEITLMAILLSNDGFMQAGFLGPLVAGTFLFERYVEKEHFRVTFHLPSILCLKEDLKNRDRDISFVEKYIQPALDEKERNSNDNNNGKMRKSDDHNIHDLKEPILMPSIRSGTSVSFECDNIASNV